jgi:hypothetical protein
VKIEISSGELFDRLTIIEIKLERIAAPEKQARLKDEYDALCQLRATIATQEIAPFAIELKEVNVALWRIEDALRDHERRQDFGPAFVELARSVYVNNDRRSALKRQIDLLLGSTLMEEKSYTAY